MIYPMMQALSLSKMRLLCGLYISQTLGLAFVTTAIPVILRQSGVGLDKISWIFALGMLWTLKFLWAPLVDRFGSRKYGHYRSWILVLQPLMILATLSTALVSIEEQMSLFIVLISLITVFAATQDIASDGLAVTLLEPDERSIGSSIQSVGNILGFLVGGGLVLLVYQWTDWSGSLLLLAAAMMVPLLSIWSFREQRVSTKCSADRLGFKNLLLFFVRPRVWRWIPILLLFRISNQVCYWLLSPMLVDKGWTLEQIAVALNVFGLLLGVVGALVVGSMVNSWGRKASMLITMLFALLGTIFMYLLALDVESTYLVYLVIAMIMIGFGGSSTVMYTVIMDKSQKESAATDFTLQWSLSGVGAMLAGSLAMSSAETLGYSEVLLYTGGVSALVMLIIWIYPDFNANQLQGESLPIDSLKVHGCDSN